MYALPKVMRTAAIPTLLIQVLQAVLNLFKAKDIVSISVTKRVPEGSRNLPHRHKKAFSSGKLNTLARHLVGEGITARHSGTAGEAMILPWLRLQAALH